jgi:hypothetical protein
MKMLARVQNAAMTVIGVFAQTHIRHHHHLRDFLLDRANCLLDNSIFREILQPDRILFFGIPNRMTALTPDFAADSASRTASDTDS